MSSIALYQTDQIRACEQHAIDNLGLDADELMRRAGQAAFTTIVHHYPTIKRLAIFCGSGNNAGDGYVLARIAHEQGYSVIVNQYKAIEDLPSTAQHAAVQAIAAGVFCQALEEAIDDEADLIIDALLGIGLTGKVQGPLLAAINQINDSGLPVVALDIPSGLDADTGVIMGSCVRATHTITFIAYKLGMMTQDGPEQCGKILCNDLQLAPCLSLIKPAALVLAEPWVKEALPVRPKNCHKGHFGHVLVIGGGYGMPGSVYLAAQAALRVGAGLVTIATCPEYGHQGLAMLPEAMVYGIEETAELLPLLAKASVCVIGPGLGRGEWAEALFNCAIAAQLPMVIDASALRLLAQQPQYDDSWILTPHPGEAASLLTSSTMAIQVDRYHAVNLLQQRYGGTIVLKGLGSLVCTLSKETFLCAAGNPGMASAGMGDVLSGVIAGLLAQGLSLADAAKAGVWLHASAGDALANKRGERGLLASDLMPYLQSAVNSVRLTY